MGASSVTIGKSANRRAAKTGGRSRHFRRFGPRFVQTARGVFPNKTALYLSELTGDPVRTWERWLSEDRMSCEAVGALLASDCGFQIVDAVASESPWWRAVRRALASYEEMQEAMHALTTATQAAPTVRVSDLARGADRAVVRGNGKAPSRT